MSLLWRALGLVLVLAIAAVNAKPTTSNGGPMIIPVVPGQPNSEDLRQMYSNFQRQLEEENEFLQRLEAPQRIQYGTIKTRRAPSIEGYEFNLQALDNLRKPRFGR
ncbi:hypothetical protein M3Y94_00585500 [Aphelenchoides besseyi]|nr:hypothetical protein M3Y94_00585500 [Aphelenchoides besseyi]